MTLYHSEDKLVTNVFPVGMQNSELVLQDDERNSVVSQLDELSSVSEQNVNPSAINIENSTDVIIGPVTQFHGPVTIYQHVNGNSAIDKKTENETIKSCQNGKFVKSEITSSDTSHAVEKPNNKIFVLLPRRLRYIGIAVLVIIIISIITTCAIILSSKSSPTKPSEPPASTDFHTNTDKSNDDDGNSLKPIESGSRVNRKDWNGHKPLNFTKPLQHPVPLVIISHTATPFCATFVKCSRRVLSIQEYHMNELGSPDVGYNFLIGGDANVYVGRGWDVRNFHSANSIGISFIGNYINDHLTEPMINSTKALLKEGVDNGKLAKDYKLVGHNQTFATLSPGRNVYNVIQTWPHFDPHNYRKT